MTTKELIKLLKKVDPSGNTHVRIVGDGDCPTDAHKLAGYYDGGYSYEKNGCFHITKNGCKVDIYTTDYEEFIWCHDGDYSKIRLDKNLIEENIQRYITDFIRVSREYTEAIKEIEKNKEKNNE